MLPKASEWGFNFQVFLSQKIITSLPKVMKSLSMI